MKHFDSKDWIDFARGTLADSQKTKLQNHLNDGCDICKEESNLWAWMTSFAAQESKNEPPEAAVRIAKAAGPGVPEKSRFGMREVAELIFDSYSQPQVAGVRSSTLAPRQLLYRAGAVMIDMKMQAAGKEDHFALLGQVVTSGEDKRALRQVPVHLLSGTDELASTSTNQFGEFYLEHEKTRDLQVSLEVSSDRNVFIPLDECIWRVAFGH
jgi:hypothetical protein